MTGLGAKRGGQAMRPSPGPEFLIATNIRRQLVPLSIAPENWPGTGALMYVNVAVLKETQPHERRLALVPFVEAVRGLGLSAAA